MGDDETPADAGDINIGGQATVVAPGGNHTCVLLDNKRVQCWGNGDKGGLDPGTLGYEETEDIGDDESPASAGDVAVGGDVMQIAAGDVTRCALLEGGNVRCWGHIVTTDGFEAFNAIMGQGEEMIVGDNETPAQVPPIDLTEPAELLANNHAYHQCAAMQSGAVRCWGLNTAGQLGLGHKDPIGDDELPSSEAEVRLLE